MTIGVLCGLYAEAKIADRLPHVLVGCTATRKDRAEKLIGFFLEKKVRRLISFGLAAGLSPDLEAGDLLLGATVVSERGAWEADETWNARLIECLPCYQCAPVWGSDTLLKTAQEKRGVAARSGCLAADMESHFVAQAAARARIPFNIIRAVSDSFLTDLPPAAILPLMEDGKVDLRGVISSVYRKPSQLLSVIRLGRGTQKAFASLRHAVSVISELEEG